VGSQPSLPITTLLCSSAVGAHIGSLPTFNGRRFQWSTLDIHFLRVGSQNAIEMTSGLAYYFNPQASKSFAIKRMIARRAAIKAAIAGIR
jgi:hypothetical protein